ncbi:S9 family peptidase [Psychromicrobium lacuslunae]|uniref:S9 family peptidase n=1 Tax=Psychromicrobium lacuslunae TaxID=1618207 RepID=UPI000698993B|nr:prolyl oligopeptidase family serine peptidase [Psychromicrobium lacuslunae]
MESSSQQLYKWSEKGGAVALTCHDPGVSATRYAAPITVEGSGFLYAVREREFDTETVHDIVAVAIDGSERIVEIASGSDFYGAPAISPDGRRLAYVAWEHPNMAWDQSSLHELGPEGEHIIGSVPGRSYTQPRYGPDGRLHVVHDGSGWWNLYIRPEYGGDDFVALAPQEAEFGRPDWNCGQRTYDFLEDGRIVAAARSDGRDRLIFIEPATGLSTELPDCWQAIETVSAAGGTLAVLGARHGEALNVSLLETSGTESPMSIRERYGNKFKEDIPSPPQKIVFPARDGKLIHAFYYPTVGSDYQRPLLVLCHGGPSVTFNGARNYLVDFWTSRGVAVVEVNYRGSTGYGRDYRESLRGRWGIADVEDCIDATRYLIATGKADPERIAIRGLSSGGLTALLAAAQSDEFAAVISFSGVIDPSSIPDRTHKMESHYLTGLIGPWPAALLEYQRRSVLSYIANLNTPTLLLHGTADPIVPIDQSERLKELLIERQVPVRLVLYPGEGHGLRMRSNIIDSIEQEAAFLAEVFGSADLGPS